MALKSSSNLLTLHKEQQKRRTQTGQLTLKKMRREPSTVSVLLSKLQPVAHTASFSFLSPHPSPLCHSPSTVREKASLAVTVGPPGSGNAATRPHAFSWHDISRAAWQPSQVPSPPRKGTPFRMTHLARKYAKHGCPHCARENRTKKGLHIRTTIRRHYPNPGFLGNRIAPPCVLNQETDYRLLQMHFLPAASQSPHRGASGHGCM